MRTTSQAHVGEQHHLLFGCSERESAYLKTTYSTSVRTIRVELNATARPDQLPFEVHRLVKVSGEPLRIYPSTPGMRRAKL